jgi:hypothetical protein
MTTMNSLFSFNDNIDDNEDKVDQVEVQEEAAE